MRRIWTLAIAIVLLGAADARAQVADSFLSSTGQSCYQVKTIPGFLVSLNVDNSSASPLFILGYDASAIPSNGDATGRPIGAVGAQTSSVDGQAPFAWPIPLRFMTGIVVCCSSTGASSLTKSANCTFAGQKQ